MTGLTNDEIIIIMFCSILGGCVILLCLFQKQIFDFYDFCVNRWKYRHNQVHTSGNTAHAGLMVDNRNIIFPTSV